MIRGEIWWADYGIPFGSEPGFRRPVVIIQDDAFNSSSIGTTIVVPLTTNLALVDAPGNVLLEKERTGLAKDSAVVVSQIAVLDKARLIDRIKRLGPKQFERIEKGIKLVLGLQD